MSVIDTIYKASVKIDDTLDDGLIFATIAYGDCVFSGFAFLHEDDAEFYSKKVGTQIAKSRARQKAFKYEKEKALQEYKSKLHIINEATGYGTRELAEIDPTGVFQRNMKRAKWRYENISDALDREKKNLNNYIEGQAKMVESVRRYREKQQAPQSDNIN